MKVLWIVNSILRDFNLFLYGKEGHGFWMEALLGEFKEKGEHELVVATATLTKQTIKYKKDGVVYYALPDTYPLLYNEKKKGNMRAWEELIQAEKPDVIHVFGTEFSHGLCALRVKGDIPVILHMQGVLASIAKFYQAGLSNKEFRTCTLRDFLKRDSMRKQQKRYFARAKKEVEMIALSKNVISENDWCNAYVKAVAPDAQIYYRAESMNTVFAEAPWAADEIEQYTIGCNASGYPIKGLHILLKAVALLKEKYPAIKLHIPGPPVVAADNFKARLKKSGYAKYIEKLIAKLQLQEQVVWVGNQSQKDLAEHNRRLHVFVMPSVIENHSNSLKEAMMQGIPCVASAVGGVTSYAKHGENALLYRPEEFEMLAYHLDRLFQDFAYAKELGIAGKAAMQELHESAKIYQKTIEIYRQVLKKSL